MRRVLVTGGSGFIGTNLVDVLLEQDVVLLNVDINPPNKDAHAPYWQKCDIMDLERTASLIDGFQPDCLIHLAARTDTLSENLDEYRVNFEGTKNILSCIQNTPCIQRVIITSSQFAFAPPGMAGAMVGMEHVVRTESCGYASEDVSTWESFCESKNSLLFRPQPLPAPDEK